MSSILNAVSAMRPATPAPDKLENEALALRQHEDRKIAAEQRQKNEETFPGSIHKLSEADSVIGAESAKASEQTAVQQTAAAPLIDTYVHGQEPEPAGLYRIARDENGQRSIIFDDPEKQKTADRTEGMKQAQAADTKPEAPSTEQSAKPESSPKAAEDKASADEPETVTGSTDKVDREIKQLKEKLESLNQQLARSQDNPDEAKSLEREISQVENELRLKDTDAYRRQHTQFS